MPKRFEQIRIDAIGFGICVLASLAVYSAWVHPFLAQRKLQAKQRSALAAQQEECSRLKASLAAVQGQQNIVDEELARARFDMDSIDRLNKRIALLTTFFASCELSVNNINAGEPCRGLPYTAVPINVTGRGTCAQWALFLHRFSQSFADMSVTAVTLRGYPADSKRAGDFQFELLWYAVPEDEDPATKLGDPTSKVVSVF